MPTAANRCSHLVLAATRQQQIRPSRRRSLQRAWHHFEVSQYARKTQRHTVFLARPARVEKDSTNRAATVPGKRCAGSCCRCGFCSDRCRFVLVRLTSLANQKLLLVEKPGFPQIHHSEFALRKRDEQESARDHLKCPQPDGSSSLPRAY